MSKCQRLPYLTPWRNTIPDTSGLEESSSLEALMPSKHQVQHCQCLA